jgi:GNAT superfamily N-acetyltransferase
MQLANVQPAASSTSQTNPCECECAKRFVVRLARGEDYKEFKRILNRAKYPAFIGRELMAHNANNGGALFYEFQNEVIAVSLLNPHYSILLALGIVPEHRSHGLGTAIFNFLVPNFVRVVEHNVPWVAHLGYRAVGKLKRGVKFNTQVMVREALFDLADNLQKAWTE